MKTLTSFLLITLLWGSLLAKPASYEFCVSSSGFTTFKAVVTFNAIDFGENAARQLVMGQVKDYLGDDVKIATFIPESCKCKGDCPVLRIDSSSKQNTTENGDASDMLSSAAMGLDKVVYKAKEMFNDPGGFIKRTFFGED